MSAPTTFHGLDGPDGRPLAALFTGPGAETAARLWAAVLHEQRDVLARRGAAYRRRQQRAGYRRLRFGKAHDASEAAT